jgi:hypothetical protein
MGPTAHAQTFGIRRKIIMVSARSRRANFTFSLMPFPAL